MIGLDWFLFHTMMEQAAPRRDPPRIRLAPPAALGPGSSGKPPRLPEPKPIQCVAIER